MSLLENCTNSSECDVVTSVFVRLSDEKNIKNVWETEALIDFVKGVGRMFYIVSPAETTFSNAKDVPNFFRNAWPYFLLFMIVENILLWIEKKPLVRLNDSITSLSHGLIKECGRLLFRSSESYLYFYIYEHFRICDLPWDMPITWYLAAIGVDFCYYWVHRACHEVHILWAQHQVHHSSEDYNLAVGLRQSVLQGWCGFAFYLPLALIIPPSHFITHQHFNLLFQFWIHTETVSTLGPLEWIFNTPNHHRVHHGSNIYCLDTNYGGVLIIWDRIFGTFAKEKEDEEIIYGLVYNQPSFNVLHLQTFYTHYVITKFNAMKSWREKLAAIFYGPSWQPGRPRLGTEEDKVKVTKRTKYDVQLSLWCNLYLMVHFSVMVYGFHQLALRYMALSPISVLAFVIYIIASLTNIGMLFDKHKFAPVFEVLRCMILVTVVQRMSFPDIDSSTLLLAEVFFLLSGIFWFLQSISILEISSTLKTTSRKRD
ncbi:alkylglycerol monooxygenase-like [Sitophilus oryzae]|uniref:Alkylglycerol monooxygenase n=1 Tax=Sitophilus oryzae TaxID=7048 RepID=A0A6J2Y669_SITOR|nr:alkylglycerol monooxygenase-like [Sitophilus oryzae]